MSVAAQDRDLRYVWAYNQRSAGPDQIVGHLDHEIFTAEEAAHFTAIERRVLEEGIEQREQIWLDRPTGRMYLDIIWEPIRDRDGRIIGVASATVDLTTTKLAEEALRESEERERQRAAELQAIMEAVPAAVFIALDPECRSIFGSRCTYDLFRMPPGSNLSQSAPEGERPAHFRIMKDGAEIPPEEIPLQRAAATGRPVQQFEFDLVFSDGTLRHLLGNAVPLL